MIPMPSFLKSRTQHSVALTPIDPGLTFPSFSCPASFLISTYIFFLKRCDQTQLGRRRGTGVMAPRCLLTPECCRRQHSSHVRQADRPQSRKGPAVMKTECSVGAPQGHRRHWAGGDEALSDCLGHIGRQGITLRKQKERRRPKKKVGGGVKR